MAAGAKDAPRIGPSKKVAQLSEDLERLLAEEQLRQKAPPGMEKCPVCGAIVVPTRTRKVRTHDDPVKGRRCDGSGPDEWNVKLYQGIDQQASGGGSSQVVQLNGQPNHIGGLCSNGLACVAGGDRCLLDYFEVALDAHGLPVVTWANCILGTGVGVAVQGTDIYFGGLASGTPLR